MTPGGLVATSHFFTLLFPAMLAVLMVFRIGTFASGATLRRPFGLVLIGMYIVITMLSYTNHTAW